MTSENLASLRNRHPALRYLSYQTTHDGDSLSVEYLFRLEPDLDFRHRITIPSPDEHLDATADRLIFLLGMIELISYWKTACPEKILVDAGALNETEIRWWEHLYRQGLGEFFFLNAISPLIDFSITASAGAWKPPSSPPDSSAHGRLVLVGGGKDSIVSLELVKKFSNVPLQALCVNPISASLDAIALAGYPSPLVIQRVIDPRIHELNRAGYLNGHIPYSAFLAFVSTLTAWLHGFSEVITSNETSASEGNAFIEGIEVNHQYSKGIEFEEQFRAYMDQAAVPVSYYSFLRPLNELQICALFSQQKKFHSVFRSCNREQTLAARQRNLEASTLTGPGVKRTGWCGECPKCVFTWICLATFLPLVETDRIFGISPLSYPSFSDISRDLAGKGAHKPFECVGTYQEVQVALKKILSGLRAGTDSDQSISRTLEQFVPDNTPDLKDILKRWDNRNFLPQTLADRLQSHLTVVAGSTQ